MKTHSETTLNFQDVPRLFSKYWAAILIATICSTSFFIFASFQIPKRYKAYFVLTIYSKYFQNPLIGSFLPGVSESMEMRSQRESLIREVISPEYLDALQAKYKFGEMDRAKSRHTLLETLRTNARGWMQQWGVTTPPNPESLLSAQREALRNRIDIIAINNTTFMVGFSYSDPDTTFQTTRDLYDAVIHNLLEERMHSLVNVRDAIQKRLGSLSSTLKRPASTPSSTGERSVRDELASVREQIRVLTSEYTEEHPRVVQLREQEKNLVSRLESLAINAPEGKQRPSHLLDQDSEDSVQDLYDDLSTKLSYLNIALDSDNEHQSEYFATLEPPVYPSAPLWPKKALFALWGFTLGLFGSFFLAALKEYFDRSALHGDALAHQLGIPYLGHLPIMPPKVSVKTVFGE